MQARRSASFRGSAARSAERRTYAVNALARLCAHTLTSSADTINGNASPTLRDAITYANAKSRHHHHVLGRRCGPDDYPDKPW